MALHESGQMYLETIYLLSQSSPAVRSIDIVEHMGYSKPSVSRAIGLLKNGGYLFVDQTEALTVIDVNTGKCVSHKKDDENYLKLKPLIIDSGDTSSIVKSKQSDRSEIIFRLDKMYKYIKKVYFIVDKHILLC